MAFWSDKQFKYCRKCERDRPLREFNKWNEVPHRNCRECWESETCKKRAAAREAAILAKRQDTHVQRGGQSPIHEDERNKLCQVYKEILDNRIAYSERVGRVPNGVLRGDDANITAQGDIEEGEHVFTFRDPILAIQHELNTGTDRHTQPKWRNWRKSQ